MVGRVRRHDLLDILSNVGRCSINLFKTHINKNNSPQIKLSIVMNTMKKACLKFNNNKKSILITES